MARKAINMRARTDYIMTPADVMTLVIKMLEKYYKPKQDYLNALREVRMENGFLPRGYENEFRKATIEAYCIGSILYDCLPTASALETLCNLIDEMVEEGRVNHA